VKLGLLLQRRFRRKPARKSSRNPSATKKTQKRATRGRWKFLSQLRDPVFEEAAHVATQVATVATKVASVQIKNPVQAQPEVQAETQLPEPLPGAAPQVQPFVVPTSPARAQKAPSAFQQQSTQLTARELIRPDDRLRSSMEGFLLDQRSPHTRKAYSRDLKRFLKFLIARKFPDGDPGTLNRSVLIGYKDYLLAEDLEHTTIDRHLATLRSFFQWLVDDGIIEKSPAAGVRFLNPKRLSTTAGLSDEEVCRMLELPNLHTRTGSLHYAVLMVLFYCGLRRSELCDLRTSNLSQERGQPLLKLRGKGNAERLIPLIPAVWSAIRHYARITTKDLRLDQPLFTPVRNNRGGGEVRKPLDPSMIFYVVTKYAKEAGVAHRVSPHSCRATAISNARDRNVPDRAIQEFAGWMSPNMITRYDKRRTSIENSAAKAISYGQDPRLLLSLARETEGLPEPALEDPTMGDVRKNALPPKDV
jgi:integrase/recombinase XerD